MTNRYERLKIQRRMQRRIRMVVEERRLFFAEREEEPATDPEATMEIPPPDLAAMTVLPQRAVGRVALSQL